jgi:hypothetical protein
MAASGFDLQPATARGEPATARGEPATARGEPGMATAELALAMPVLVAVLALALAGIELGMQQVRCVDAARSAVRLMARGEPPERVMAAAELAAPSGAVVSTGASAGRVSVMVSAAPPALLRVVGITSQTTATAVAVAEQEG